MYLILVWSTNIEEKMLSKKFRILKLAYLFGKLHPFSGGGLKRKVKAVSPSPLYDGKYHPPDN